VTHLGEAASQSHVRYLSGAVNFSNQSSIWLQRDLILPQLLKRKENWTRRRSGRRVGNGQY